MIYVASLNAPVKKAFGDKCYATNVNKITEQMSLDPEVSGMDACVLGPKDVVGINKQRIAAALKSKHPNICVVYLYTKDKEGEQLDIPTKQLIKKMDAQNVKDAVEGFVQADMVTAGKAVVSRDSKVTKPITSRPETRLRGSAMKGGLTAKEEEPVVETEEPDLLYDPAIDLYYYLDPLGQIVYCDKDTRKPLSPLKVKRAKEAVLQKTENLADVPIPGFEDENDFSAGGEETMAEEVPVAPAPEPIPEPVTARVERTLESNLESIRDFHDWNLFKEAMQKDTVVRALLEENSSFQGCVQMMSVLDEEIRTTFYDTGLTANQKFEKILEVGGRKSTLAATYNDILSKKVLSVMEAITISARRTVEELLMEHRNAMEKITVSDKDIADETTLADLISKRTNAEIELLALIKGIITLYQAMDITVSNVILDMDKNLPSDNAFINNMVGSIADVLTPTNTKELAVTMMRALQNHREQFTLLQDSVEKLIDGIHNLVERDRDLIMHQQYVIKMLKSHRVEDAVVLDGVLKNVLHVYVGAENTGRTATTLTWSGVLSRRGNTLFIDLSQGNKLEHYGVQPVALEDFMTTRIERELCVVKGRVRDHEHLMEIIKELRTRLDYYMYVNILCDHKDEDYIRLLSQEARTVNYITNCTNTSMQDMAAIYSRITTENVARKVIMIDPPIDILRIARKMNLDTTITKCVTVPNVSKIKMCAVTGDVPYEYVEVRTVYEEAFR